MPFFRSLSSTNTGNIAQPTQNSETDDNNEWS